MFMYDNDIRIIADLNPTTGNIQSRYVYVSQSHSPDYMIRGIDTYQFVKDHLGSIKLVVKVSDGSITQEITYDEFGKVLSDTNPGFQPFGFAGGVYDAQTSLTKFGVRDYDAEVGRWLTKDPILFAGGDANLYGYVLMDPINFIDPFGLKGLTSSQRIVGGVVIGLAGVGMLGLSGAALPLAGGVLILGGCALAVTGAFEFGLEGLLPILKGNNSTINTGFGE